jgi:toxin ParE1/3/4
MAHLIWTESALSDLNDIAEYIELENPSAARQLVRGVFSVVERLEQHPSSGRIPIELKDGRYREVIYGPCRIFYRHTNNQVFVVYVMRSERQLRNFLLEGRGSERN